MTGAQYCEEPAIRAWHDADSSVLETDINISSDGMFILSAKAWNVSGGIWQYEYALYNMNSDRAADGFSVPLPTDLCKEQLSDIAASAGFHDINYHSGEVYDPTDWDITVSSGSISWATHSYSPSSNANALRWGTLYNFRFQAPRAANNPSTTTINATVDLFKSGSPSYVTGASLAPVESTAHKACCYGGEFCILTTHCYCDDLDGVWTTATSCEFSGCAMSP